MLQLMAWHFSTQYSSRISSLLPTGLSCRYLLLKMWSPDQKKQWHLKTYERNSESQSPCPELPDHNLNFSKILRWILVHVLMFEESWCRIWAFQPGCASGQEPVCNAGNAGDMSSRHEFNPWVRKIPWRRAWWPTAVFLPGEFPRREEAGGLQSMGSKRIQHNWSDLACICIPKRCRIYYLSYYWHLEDKKGGMAVTFLLQLLEEGRIKLWAPKCSYSVQEEIWMWWGYATQIDWGLADLNDFYKWNSNSILTN